MVVYAANKRDTNGGIFPVLEAMIRYPSIKGISADAGYRCAFAEEIKEYYQISVEIPEKDPKKAWQILPMRWMVERAFSWLNSSPRLSKDYEITTSSAEAFINISHIRALLRRL